MAKPTAAAKEVKAEPKKEATLDFKYTGIARGIVCFDNQGFRNFKVVTMTIENGTVVSHQMSDPYANWDAAQHLDYWNDISLINLNNNWKPGQGFLK